MVSASPYVSAVEEMRSSARSVRSLAWWYFAVLVTMALSIPVCSRASCAERMAGAPSSWTNSTMHLRRMAYSSTTSVKS